MLCTALSSSASNLTVDQGIIYFLASRFLVTSGFSFEQCHILDKYWMEKNVPYVLFPSLIPQLMIQINPCKLSV